MKKIQAWRIRQQLSRLHRQWEKLEITLTTKRRGMIEACLVPRRELAGGKLRKTPAFYLSRKVKGMTRLKYVPKERLEEVRHATDSWREFSSTLAEWVKLTKRMERLFRELGKAQQTKIEEE